MTIQVVFVHAATLSARVRTNVISMPIENSEADVGSELPWPGGIATAETPRRY